MKDSLSMLWGAFAAKDFRLFLQPLVALVAISLAACANPGQIKDVEAPVTGESIVFGRADLYRDGKPLKTARVQNRMVHLLILPSNSSQAFDYLVRGDGRFYLGLAPGDYMVLGAEVQESLGFPQSGMRVHPAPIRAKFSVPEGASSVYVGTIEVRLEQERSSVEVRDNSASDTVALRERYPGIVGKPVKQLVQTEQALGKFDYVVDVCAERWGIDCTEQYRGVEPITPKVGTKFFPNKVAFGKVDSVRPTLSWRGSSQPSVTYDLVVSEAAAYGQFGEIQYMAGRVSIYAEGIHAPEFQVQSALKPATKYFWSVRLREGDTVSHWSRFDYFKFYLVSMWRGQHMFAFETPES